MSRRIEDEDGAESMEGFALFAVILFILMGILSYYKPEQGERFKVVGHTVVTSPYQDKVSEEGGNNDVEG